MKRIQTFIAGVACYAVGLVSFVVLGAFIGNFGLPTTLDSPARGSRIVSVIVDVGLVLLFALQHSVMARPAFKDWWTQFIPRPLERSIYALASAFAVFILCLFWQPVGGTIWNLENPAAREATYALYAFGWISVVATTFLLNHFDLFGLRQVWLHLWGRDYTPLPFATPGPYKFIRHPLYIGWFIVSWTAPTMTISHLLYAVGVTTYILIAIRHEERDLAAFHGETYENYRRRVPMLVPRLTRKPARNPQTA